ncbi:hypothetical protein BXT84_12665 [Sulfobacillus thermotolerans]|uniref:Uncharacterized protein n=1 Tax=Sulfobacillus thermotolerans TaxID=338644 RepID=A0ABN5H1Y4_9FIRM|nr:hypothetical protein BXT84_12665 [Sulfobacillus thermotolerans]
MTTARSDVLKFVKDHVLNISDLTRTSKLAEILEMYANEPSDEVFIVQNTRNKHGRAVIANLEFFEELLMYKEAIDTVIDQMMDQIALERKEEPVPIPLAQVISELALDVNRIAALSETVEEE